MAATSLAAVLIDDEAPARLELRRMLEAYPELRIVGEAESVDEAATVVVRTRPDVLFLDIALGAHTGFDLLSRLDRERLPDVVFVTAYEEHALRAFEVNALSYLLKPVERQRLSTVIDRLLARSPSGPATSTVLLGLDDYLFLELRGGWSFVKVGDVQSITAEGNYSRVTIAGGQSALVRQALAAWNQRLPERRFAQIHRSTIVNMDAVVRVETISESTHRVFLRDVRAPLLLSRRYVARLQQQLK